MYVIKFNHQFIFIINNYLTSVAEAHFARSWMMGQQLILWERNKNKMIHLVTTRLTIGFHTQVFPYHNYDFCFLLLKVKGMILIHWPFLSLCCWFFLTWFSFLGFAHRLICRLSKFKPSLVFTHNQLILIFESHSLYST
jgi:hypothetical protein